MGISSPAFLHYTTLFVALFFFIESTVKSNIPCQHVSDLSTPPWRCQPAPHPPHLGLTFPLAILSHVDALDNIRDHLAAGNEEDLLNDLKKLCQELNKDESNRKLAESQGAGALLLASCKHCVKNEELLTAGVDAFGSFLNGQGNVASSETIQFLLQCLKDFKDRVNLSAVLIKAIRLSCIKSEANRQTFVHGDIIPTLINTLKTHQQCPLVIKEACFALRVLTFDDDMSVPFGKAHEHAKLIVAESAIAVLLNMLDVHQQDVEVASELMSTLGRLAVREEFCKEVVDLGGLKIILQILQNNIEHQVKVHVELSVEPPG